MRNTLAAPTLHPGVGVLALTAVILVAGYPLATHAGEIDNAGFNQAYLGDFGRVSQKTVDLAEAIPEESYGWRPADGIRSTSEVFMHVANANFFFASQLGVARPEDLPGDLEKVTDKAQVQRFLELSMEQIRQMAEHNAGEDLDGKELDLFGNKMTARGLYFIAIGHLHEHLGQAIAYGRSNGVVPPWSRPSPGGQDG
jgi:uncharacterized damage-inducible protein DinB